MTDLVAQAKDYAMSRKLNLSEPTDITHVIGLIEDAYIVGAKGNWHNIKKDPADLPSPYRNSCSKAVITDKHHIAYYDHSDGFWYDWDQDFQLMADVVAWCDFPNYEE